jgi:ribulose-phosphate 3-epimerase
MRAPLVAPSILACDFGWLAREIGRVEAAGADWIHVDVMDGHFVPNLTIGPGVVAAARAATALPLDVHLMIDAPDRYLEGFARAGATMLTVHAEATTSLWRTVQRIRELGVRPGVALNPGSPLELVMEVLGEVDMVLLMTVEPGFGGQRFIPSVTGKVRRLRDVLDARGLETHVEVDGGIDRTTAGAAAGAGADVLVAGTAVFGAPDFAEAIAALREAARQGAR